MIHNSCYDKYSDGAEDETDNVRIYFRTDKIRMHHAVLLTVREHHHVSDWLISCCGNLILHQKKEIKMIKT